jgi:ABC-type branched-subunit amino acid transport system substrate-binding protein
MLLPAVELHILLPLSGDLEEAGGIQWEVVRVAAMRLNESRSPRDRALQPIIHDCGSTQESAKAAAEALASAGIVSFVGPAASAPVLGLQDLVDIANTLIVLPDAQDLPANLGGMSTIALIPPDALRGMDAVDVALTRLPSAKTVGQSRPTGAAPSDAAAAAMAHAVRRGLRPSLATEADVVVLQANADPPADLMVRVGPTVVETSVATRSWIDPALPESSIWMDHERATSATYDAVIALGRALQRHPDASAEVLRATLVGTSWEGMLGPTKFRRAGPRRAWFGHPPESR